MDSYADACQVEGHYPVNNMFEPKFGIATHQPYGFDQLIARYAEATVLYAVFTFEVAHATLGAMSADHPTRWNIALVSSEKRVQKSTTAYTQEEMMEHPSLP